MSLPLPSSPQDYFTASKSQKPETKAMTAVSQANVVQGLRSWAPACLWTGERRIFLPQGGPVPGESQRMFLLQKRRAGLGILVLGGQWSWPVTPFLGSKQPAPPSAYRYKAVCAVEERFGKGLNVSESTTAAMSLLHFYVERPFC